MIHVAMNELLTAQLQGVQTQLQCESWLQWGIGSSTYVDRWMNGDVGRRETRSNIILHS